MPVIVGKETEVSEKIKDFIVKVHHMIVGKDKEALFNTPGLVIPEPEHVWMMIDENPYNVIFTQPPGDRLLENGFILITTQEEWNDPSWNHLKYEIWAPIWDDGEVTDLKISYQIHTDDYLTDQNPEYYLMSIYVP